MSAKTTGYKKESVVTQQHNQALKKTGVFALSLLASSIALAQQAPQITETIQEISVSASRIRADGFSAPTPVLTLSEDLIKATAPMDLGEALSQLPQFNSSSQSSTAVVYANLRNIGSERTLVLLNGRRHVPTFSSGVVDLTTIPTALVSRTELVTGGASASWGSDAVSGVVNLILKDDLEGFDGNMQYGRSRFNDDETFSISFAGGTKFDNDRGHILLGVEWAESEGIPTYIYPDVSRPNVAGRGSVINGNYATGLPQFIYAQDVRRADVHDGGLITSGPLRGTTFLPNGQTGQFDYGHLFNNNMIGGGSNPFEGPEPGGDIKSPFERKSFLGRVRYDFSESLSGFFEFNYSESLSNGRSVLPRNQGSTAPNNGCTRTGYSGSRFGNINVSIDNAFLPDSVRQDMQDLGINCFNFGRSFREEGLGIFRTGEGSPGIKRFVAGLNGRFNDNWTWDGYVQYGDSSFQQRREGNIHSVRFQAAVDAVRHPDTGEIVCRINIDGNPSNDDPNCVPFNMFGAGSPSMAAQQYVIGTSTLDMDIQQTVAAFNVQGELMELWAGPVVSAFGVEYREEKLNAWADEDSENNIWQTSNRKGLRGRYDVTEFYGEVAAPLLVDKPFMEVVDLSLAARFTDYSTSGSVQTWKIGSNWSVNDQVRFRFTKSRDIRAGNIGELFTPTAVALGNVNNPITNVRVPVQTITTGNPVLDPEKADTVTAGVVISPNAIEGLQLSVDYYSIDITDQIGTISAQGIVDQCYIWNENSFCGRIETDANGLITGINNSFFNLDRFKTSGTDIMGVYNTEMGPGNLFVRLTASYVGKRENIFEQDGSRIESAGQFGNPHWKVFSQIRYSLGNFSALVDWRWYEGTKINNYRIEGFAGPQGANVNTVPSLHYTGLNLTYNLSSWLQNWNGDVYLRVDNLFDKEPPFPLRSAYNDNFGRGYRAGIRFNL